MVLDRELEYILGKKLRSPLHLTPQGGRAGGDHLLPAVSFLDENLPIDASDKMFTQKRGRNNGRY